MKVLFLALFAEGESVWIRSKFGSNLHTNRERWRPATAGMPSAPPRGLEQAVAVSRRED